MEPLLDISEEAINLFILNRSPYMLLRLLRVLRLSKKKYIFDVKMTNAEYEVIVLIL